MKRISKFRVVLIALTVLTVCFIWGQSVLSVEKSGNESEVVTEKVVQPIEEKVTGKKTITDAVVRKWAHGLEHAVLGIELVLLLGKSRAVKAFSYGVGVALLDETIQIFSGRGSEVRDIWIDALGVLIGIGIGMVVQMIKKKKKPNLLEEI